MYVIVDQRGLFKVDQIAELSAFCDMMRWEGRLGAFLHLF